MSECYSAALAANTTTDIALFVDALVGWLLGKLLGKLLVMALDRWETHRDRKRLAELLEAEKAELERLRASE